MIFQKSRESAETRAQNIKRLAAALQDADAVLIGAGAGLSTSAGFTYAGERFEKHFADFHARYGFSDMYSGGFYPYDSLEAFWAFWSRNIMVNRYMDAPKPVYADLFSLVRNKDYFVLTTNVDHCFQKAGFAKERLFYTQGDYGLFQCSAGTTPICKTSTYDNESAVREMYERQKDRRIPAELVPRCPICHMPLPRATKPIWLLMPTSTFCCWSWAWAATRRASSSTRSGNLPRGTRTRPMPASIMARRSAPRILTPVQSASMPTSDRCCRRSPKGAGHSPEKVRAQTCASARFLL